VLPGPFAACPAPAKGKLAEFLASDAAQRERRYELSKEQFLGECRLRQLEPPSADQAARYVRSALFQARRPALVGAERPGRTRRADAGNPIRRRTRFTGP
jgi:hypothetical protein